MRIRKGRRVKVRRIEWIDIFKLLGIAAIFCGHLGRETGGLHDFVFLYHVPLFFFASGIFADRLAELSVWRCVGKKFKQIMLPYLFFVGISMIVIILTTEENIYTYLGYGRQFVYGIRNQMYASSLWFFSCLFCMSIFFDLLRRIFKNRFVLLVISVLIYFVTIYALPNRPDQAPSWIFNVDSALHYLIYYAIGYCFREKLTEEPVAGSIWVRIAGTACAVSLACYTLLVYMHKDVLGEALCRSIPGANAIYPVMRTLLLILFHIVLAKLLAGIGNLHEVGAQTLWLCGNEFVVKRIFNAIADTMGIRIGITSALAAVLYACVMIWFIYKVLMPVEKRLYHRLLACVGMEGI